VEVEAMPLEDLGYDQLVQLRKDLQSHIPGDPSWHASVGAILRHMLHKSMAVHPDNPVNKPEGEKTPEEKRADEIRALQAKHAQERADEAAPPPEATESTPSIDGIPDDRYANPAQYTPPRFQAPPVARPQYPNEPQPA
jgi:hypothetical protein